MNNNQLINLAQNNPKQLVKLLQTTTDTTTLSNAIEILAEEVSDESIVLPLIKILLRHTNAIVREGACSAVSSFYYERQIPSEILDRLTNMSQHDPSLIIKKYTEDLLSQLK